MSIKVTEQIVNKIIIFVTHFNVLKNEKKNKTDKLLNDGCCN